MSNWTPEQEAAILARGASVAVSAAAGSGKTSVLVERLIGLLADPAYPAERMVVVTFTNDAAGEVRARLNRALTARILKEPENEWLRRQQTMLHSAKINTIHGFCFDLLRDQFAALDISAGFRIMEPTEEAELRAAAVSETLEAFSRLAAEDDAAKAEQKCLLDAFCPGDDTPLESLILSLFELTENTPFGENLPEEAAKAYEDNAMRQYALDALTERVTEILSLYTCAKSIAEKMQADKAAAVLQDEQIQVEQLRDALSDGDLSRISTLISAFHAGRLTLPRKDWVQEKAAVKTLRNRAVGCMKKLNAEWAVPLAYAESDLPRHAALLRTLAKLVRDFAERLSAWKRERSALGFGDAMTLTLSLLAKKMPNGSIVRTQLAEQLSEQYVCIMIDEFQDTDDQQDLIFRMLSHGGSAEQYGDNLFVVGDSKQCIYRFRNANPENFYRAVRSSAAYVSPQLSENTCIYLNRNFRSAQEVVDVVNHVFSQLMTEKVGTVAYDETQMLVRGAEYPEASRPAEILLIPKSGRTAKNEPQIITNRIAWHLANGTPVRGADGELRPCEPRDFLILLRYGTKMPEYAAALTDAGIPVCTVEQQSYLQSPEILLLLDILRAVDNPMLEVPLAAAMLSPMCGFTLDELVQIRVYDKKRNLFNSMTKICEDAEKEPEKADAQLVQKCRTFLDFLESMRLCSAMETPEQLIRRVYQQTDFLGLMQMTEGGAQKKANLRALISYAHGFEENRGGGLSAFLRYLDAILARGSDLSSGGVPAGTENVVQLKTVHKSKGLEAPFVILANADHDFSRKDAEGIFQYHAKYGIGFRLHDPETLSKGKSLPWRVIYEQNRQEMLSEELRLLYVALTRAREYLILPLPYSESYRRDTLSGYAAEQTAFGGQTDSLTASVQRASDWLFMSLVRNPGCEQLRRVLELECESDPAQPFLPVYIRSEEPAEDDESEETAQELKYEDIQADTALVKQLAAQCAWQYDSKQAALTAKYGVSELAKQEDFSAPLRRPLFVREQHGLSGAERGTAVHTFMQYADFAAAASDLHREIDRLQTEGRLTARQAQAVAKSTAAAFFASDLYDRIRQAKQVWREQKFTVRLRDLQLTGPLAQLGTDYAGTDGMLIGIMDLVFEEDDGIVLVDYKTDRAEKPEDLLEHYTEQIRLYAAALGLLMEKPVKASYLYSLTLKQTVSVAL